MVRVYVDWACVLVVILVGDGRSSLDADVIFAIVDLTGVTNDESCPLDDGTGYTGAPADDDWIGPPVVCPGVVIGVHASRLVLSKERLIFKFWFR